MDKKTTFILILMLVNLVFGGTELNGPVSIDNVPAYGSTATKYLIIDGSDSIVKSRTNTQVLSDIGGASIAALNLKLNISDTSVFARDVDLTLKEDTSSNRVWKRFVDNTNFNSLIGKYSSARATTSGINTPENYISNVNFSILSGSSNYDFQLASYYGNADRYYMRHYYTAGSLWRNWVELWHSGNLDTSVFARDGQSMSPVLHQHDSIYYRESEVNTLLNGKASTSHASTHLRGGSDVIAGGEGYGIYNITDTDAWYTGINYGGLGIGSDDGTNRQMMTFTDAAHDTQAVFSVITSTNAGVNWNNKFKVTRSGRIKSSDIPALGSKATNYLTSNSGVISSRTIAQVLSDIGGQPLDATLTALAGLNSTAGFLYQTGSDAFTKYPFSGSGSANSVARSDHNHSGTYEPAISGTANRVLKIQSDGTGVIESIISDNGTTATINGAMSVSGNINVGGLTASRIVETDATKTLVSVAKNTAYNKNFGTASGTVCQGNDSRLSDARTILSSGSDWNTITDNRANTSSTNGPVSSSVFIGLNIVHNSSSQYRFQIMGRNNGFYVRTMENSTWNDYQKLWTEANDGTGSGLDADLLDGQHGSWYQQAIAGTANRILKVQSDGTGYSESSITDDGTNVNFTNTGYTLFKSALYIGGLPTSVNSFFTDNNYALIYSTGTNTGSYPFNNYGHLIIQAQSTQPRSILFVAGTTPEVKMRINPDNVVVNNPLSVDGNINVGGLTASRIVETDATKTLVSVAKNTAYNKNFGTTSGTVCQGNDSRLSDARTPTSHANTHLSGGSDQLFDQNLNTTNAPLFTGGSYRTNSGSNPLYITRSGTNTESMAMWVNDEIGHVYRKNDEYLGRFRITIENTDTENSDGSRANTAYWDFTSSNTSSNLTLTKGANTYTYFHSGNLTKSDIGLGNVDNTSDLNKPISTATQTALSGKQNVDSTLTALAGLNSTAGFVYQTGTDAFTKYPFSGSGSANSVARSDHNHSGTYEPAISGTANRILKIQSDGTGVIESSITDDGTNVAFSNGGYTRFNQPLFISGRSSKTSFYTDNSYPYIYSTATESGSYPFDVFGHLIIQARSTASRNILFVAGKNPAVKMRITPDSVVVNKPLSVDGNVALNASTSGAVSSPVKLSIGVNQWSNGYTRDKLKLELAEGWGFTTGPNLDLQYHATNWHDFYNENSRIFRIGKDSVVVNGNLSLSGDIHNTILGGLSIWANGSEVLRIRDHKLGVNNTNPDSTLTVTGGANIAGGLKVGSVFRSFSDSVQINKPLQVHDSINIYDPAYGDKMSMWYSNRSEAGIINTPQYYGLEFRSNNVKYFSSKPDQTDINSARTNVKANGDVSISSSSGGVNVSSKLDQVYKVDGQQSMKVGYKKVTVAGLNIGDEYVVTNTTGEATTIYADSSGANVVYVNNSEYPTNLYIKNGKIGDVIFLTLDGPNLTYFNYKYDTNLPAHWMAVTSYTVPSMIIKCIATSAGDSTARASEWRIMSRL